MRIRGTTLSLILVCSYVAFLHAAEEKAASARELVRIGSEQLVAGNVTASIETFEKAIAHEPKTRPYLWQLGIAYYYAGRFQDGRGLFESHQTVNANDVENAVWHFLCVARAEGLETARKKLIPISGDTRVPMKEVHELFSGKGSEEAVLDAASALDKEADRRNALCYAHLYLALYHEARGNGDRSLEHIRKATGDYKQHHYMGKIADLHARLRMSVVK